MLAHSNTVVSNNDGSATVRGWAITSDAPSVGLGIRVKVDGQLAWGNWRVANEYRPDVGAAYPGYGNYHGFEFTIPVPAGTHTVTAEAQNSGVYNSLNGSVSVTAPASTATEARFWGGSYEADPGAALNYQWWRISTYYDWQIDTALVAWDNTATNLSLSRLTASPGAEFQLVTNYRAEAWWGTTTTYPCPGNSKPNFAFQCFYGYSNIDLNTRTLDLESNEQIQKVVAHEVGHALGLWHPPAGSTSLMNQGLVSGSTPMTPSAWDQTNLRTIHPDNWWETP